MAFLSTPLVALRKESVDRNILRGNEKWKQSASLSARRAWIEIASSQTGCTGRSVALRKESVDRNFALSTCLPPCGDVALRKESVDRNHQLMARAIWAPVALRKESVDRNSGLSGS